LRMGALQHILGRTHINVVAQLDPEHSFER
jgi:hypothetical protein